MCMSMEVYIDCACRFLGVCRIKRVYMSMELFKLRTYVKPSLLNTDQIRYNTSENYNNVNYKCWSPFILICMSYFVLSTKSIEQ